MRGFASTKAQEASPQASLFDSSSPVSDANIWWPGREFENGRKGTTDAALVPTTSSGRVGNYPTRFHYHCGVLALPEMELATVAAADTVTLPDSTSAISFSLPLS